MRVKSVKIANFRGIREASIDFTESNGGLRAITGVFGDNGSGKTTLLQAIGLVLSVATGRSRHADAFAWHGYLPERVSTLGRTNVEVTISFDPDEIAETQTQFEQWSANREDNEAQRPLIAPGSMSEVTLRFDGRSVRPVEGGDAAWYQFRGRYYLRKLPLRPRDRAMRFAKVGDVFWFDQYRNLGSATARNGEDNGERSSAETWVAGVESLRRYLVGMWTFHVQSFKGEGIDFIPAIERHMKGVFPGTRVVGVQPRESAMSEDPSGFYFLFERAQRIYDLAELSSGEQAVFPLVYEFVRLSIARSVVLIDELELHLHPPEQQALLTALTKLGPDCQFIVTSHSPYLADAFPVSAQVRLREGRTCR